LAVLDDLHWADAATLLLLRHVVVTDPVPNLLVVGTYRDTDLDRTHPLAGMLGELRRRSDVTRLVLEGLDAGEVTDLMTRAAGHDLEEDGTSLALAVQTETGGNPFFVGEVLRHLAESGAIVYSGGRWSAAQAGDDRLLPEGIRDVVGRRLSSLPEATQATLTLAAVIGVDFDLDILAAVSGSDEGGLIDAIEPALGAHLLIETGVGSYRFSHALVRSTLHGELSTTRRARVHRAVAEAIESLRAADVDAVTTELAYHWAEAGPATAHEQAIVYARRAAELAWARTAPDEAARWYRVARELLDEADSSLDADLAAHQAEAEMLTGVPGWQDTMHEAARAAERLGDARLMARSLCLSQRGVLIEESPEPADNEKIALLERALEIAADDPGLTAELNGALALELLFTGDNERRAQLVAATEAYGATLDDPVERHRVERLAGQARSSRSYTREEFGASAERSWAEVDEILRRREYDVAGSYFFGLFYMTMWLGRPDRARILERYGALVEDYPHPLHAGNLELARMTTALIDGRLDEADSLATNVGRLYTAHGREVEATIYSSSGQLQVARERFGLGPMIELLFGLPTGDAASSKPTAGRGLITLGLAEAGRIDEAVANLDRFGSADFADLPDDSGLPVAMSAFANAAALVEHGPACRAMYEHLLRVADIHQVTGGWYLGSTAGYLATVTDALGRPDEADQWFARAEAEHEIMRTPTWLARGRLDWAESKRRRGDSGQATELGRAAIEAIGDLDLTMSRQRAERLLTA
jgi:hypothetical protein